MACRPGPAALSVPDIPVTGLRQMAIIIKRHKEILFMTITAQRFSAGRYTADATATFLLQDEQIFTRQTETVKRNWAAAAPIFEMKDFTGARDSSAVVYTGVKTSPRLICVGLGEHAKANLERIRRAAAQAAQRARGLKCKSLAIVVPSGPFASVAQVAQAITEGVVMGTYSYDKYMTEQRNGNGGANGQIQKLLLLIDEHDDIKDARTGISIGQAVTNGVTLARDLANAPSNELTPAELAERAKGLKDQGVKVTVLDKKAIEKLGMGGLLGVNQGSVNPPFFIIMEYHGARRAERPIVLVGKGITFDTGGISIKPAAGMGDMKMDMGGAAAVIGAIRAIAELKLPHNVVGLVPTTDNMPSGSAYKPGDILRFMNGKTAEIDNTDAEGRLILADALSYADRYRPQAVVDLATLTGACVVALGTVVSGLMGNNDALKAALKVSGDRTYDRVHELPIYEEYEELIKSDVADVKNSGGRWAGTITAALFLQHFIGDYPWAHIDIAGTGISPKAWGYINKGGSGAGVRLLVDFIQNWKPLGGAA